MKKRTPPNLLAKEIAKHFVDEEPDHNYMRKVFTYLRKELDVYPNSPPRKRPYVPTEKEIKKYYDVVWRSKNIQNMTIIKTLLYTGIRVSELIRLKVSDIDLDNCQLIVSGIKGKKSRLVPFPKSFREQLLVQVNKSIQNNQLSLFFSSKKNHYSDRGIRRILEKYSKEAGLEHNISPFILRNFLLAWLKKQGIENASIQTYSGHKHRESLDVYAESTFEDAQVKYDEKIKNYPV